ncbi:hypothetical protein KIW84_031644 [Lathyrus oleraceus]|uniref:Auxin response factor n=1 Tax=Pisum sativum TaxID=3888 RepID=A0A9D4XR20_PEA|nr:hypothetical protein KIW84_031644 [Pisum sativum]
MVRTSKANRRGCNRDAANMNNESEKKSMDGNKDVDPQLWHAVAGGMVQIPEVNSKIFYFPQGHAEHAYEPVNFSVDFKTPSFIPCRVAAIDYRADPETDEVYAKLRLVPLHINEVGFDNDAVAGIDEMPETKNKYQSYTKVLTQSDANNGGGFSCPRYCAETLFPPLDYSGIPPSQYIYPTDVHGETWEFKHVYRGTPKRHLLTTNWSDFVTDKLLVSGDSLVFLRAENGDLHVGIRRSKRRNDIGINPSSKRKHDSEIGIRIGLSYLGLTSSSEEIDNKLQKNDKENGLRISDKIMGRGKVKAEDVLEAVRLGVNMQPFDVVYYPRVGTPEFFVKTSLIRTALQIRWCCGMRFKMAIETEDSSRISWFMGTIASVEAADPAWPDSLWKSLQVTWDEPDLLKNTKRVNPWQVEIVSNMPSIPFSSFLPPSRKKLRLLEHQAFPIDGQFSMPTFPNYIQTPNVPIFHLPETSLAGMQGARHDPFGLSLSDLHINKSPLGLFKPNFQQPFDHNASTSMTVPSKAVLPKANDSENVSCSASEKQDHAKPTQIVLFGQTILIDPGHENAVKKITSNFSSQLQDPPKQTSGERHEENLAGETLEIEHSGRD